MSKLMYTETQLAQAHLLRANNATATDIAKALYLAHLGGVCDAADFLQGQIGKAHDEAEAYWAVNDPARAFVGRTIASTCSAMARRLLDLVEKLNPLSSEPTPAPNTPPTPMDRSVS